MSTEHATYRIRRFSRNGTSSKNCRGSYEIPAMLTSVDDLASSASAA